jgi:hypothetical protein
MLSTLEIVLFRDTQCYYFSPEGLPPCGTHTHSKYTTPEGCSNTTKARVDGNLDWMMRMLSIVRLILFPRSSWILSILEETSSQFTDAAISDARFNVRNIVVTALLHGVRNNIVEFRRDHTHHR